MTVHDVLSRSGPRKLLALDGGGIRGIIAIEVLAEIEHLLQEQRGRGDDFVLAEYFDYIGGTSTGAVIAACLSLGMRVDRIRQFYVETGPEMFDRASLRRRFLYKYRADKLTQRLRQVIGPETTLGSNALHTLLLVVLCNASTSSPWPLSNNPHAMFNASGDSESNLQLPLWQLVRGSTAAPTYFPPEQVRVGEQTFVFVDGGISVFNNPAFQLFLMATVEPYGLMWPTGPEQMLLVSIGTGTARQMHPRLQPGNMNLFYDAASVPHALMASAAHTQDFLCRAFGDCLIGNPLDRELGDMHGVRGPADPKLFTYLRYDADLSREGLDQLLLPNVVSEHVQQLDSIRHIDDLQHVGEAVGRLVRPGHFARFT